MLLIKYYVKNLKGVVGMTQIVCFNPSEIKMKWIQKNMRECSMRINVEKQFETLGILTDIFNHTVELSELYFKKENKTSFWNIENESYGFLGKRMNKTIRATSFSWLLKGIGLHTIERFEYSQNDGILEIVYWSDKFQKMERFSITSSLSKEPALSY
jgi:hypothetical protein